MRRPAKSIGRDSNAAHCTWRRPEEPPAGWRVRAHPLAAPGLVPLGRRRGRAEISRRWSLFVRIHMPFPLGLRAYLTAACPRRPLAAPLGGRPSPPTAARPHQDQPPAPVQFPTSQLGLIAHLARPTDLPKRTPCHYVLFCFAYFCSCQARVHLGTGRARRAWPAFVSGQTVPLAAPGPAAGGPLGAARARIAN